MDLFDSSHLSPSYRTNMKEKWMNNIKSYDKGVDIGENVIYFNTIDLPLPILKGEGC